MLHIISKNNNKAIGKLTKLNYQIAYKKYTCDYNITLNNITIGIKIKPTSDDSKSVMLLSSFMIIHSKPAITAMSPFIKRTSPIMCSIVI